MGVTLERNRENRNTVLKDTGLRAQGSGHRVQGAGCRAQGTRCKVLVTGYWLLVEVRGEI